MAAVRRLGSHWVPLYKEITCCLAIEETTKHIFNGYHDYHATYGGLFVTQVWTP
jgi:hypothetical protein